MQACAPMGHPQNIKKRFESKHWSILQLESACNKGNRQKFNLNNMPSLNPPHSCYLPPHGYLQVPPPPRGWVQPTRVISADQRRNLRMLFMPPFLGGDKTYIQQVCSISPAWRSRSLALKGASGMAATPREQIRNLDQTQKCNQFYMGISLSFPFFECMNARK